jgi:aminoglycoside phosphotransferase (APT) family kinase protein
MAGTRDFPGYDVDAVEAWIRANIPALSPPFAWSKLEGGHSNLTYQLTDATGRKTVIRRPPLGELLPKAHDMAREWAVISALSKTTRARPRRLWLLRRHQRSPARAST